MSKPGPKPKSPFLRVLEGNPGRRALPGATFVCPVPLTKPDRVTDDPIASEAWDRVVAALPPNHLCALDAAVLEAHAHAASLAHVARADIDARGVIVGSTKNPSLSTLRMATDLLLRTADMLGLSLADRHRLAPASHDKPSKFDGLLAGPKPL